VDAYFHCPCPAYDSGVWLCFMGDWFVSKNVLGTIMHSLWPWAIYKCFVGDRWLQHEFREECFWVDGSDGNSNYFF